MRGTLIVMVKEPRPGRVKTRLGRDIGPVPAAWWFRHQSRRLIRRLRDRRWRLVLAVSPDREGLASRVWPPDLGRLPQGRGDLGQRMARLLRAAGPGPVCLIGADIPGVTRRHVGRAFAALGAGRVVLGPATDGGFWLIGVQPGAALPPGSFSGVRWSTRRALSDTLANLRTTRVTLVDRLADVDCADDLGTAFAGARTVAFAMTQQAPRVRAEP